MGRDTLATSFNPGFSQRDLRVDALRGLCLVVMTCNHLPNPLHAFTYQPLGFVSAAEVFVFLSGIVSAWVYGRLLLRQGMRNTVQRAWQRVSVLYLTHMGLFTVFAMAAIAILPDSKTLLGASPWNAWLLAAAFLLRPAYLGSILPMYCFFIAVAPLALHQLKRGRRWLVAVGSVALWVLGQIPGTFEKDFDPLAWQVLFVAGLIVAFPAVNGSRPVVSRSRLKTILAAAAALVFFIVRHQTAFHLHLGAASSTYLYFLWSENARLNLHPLRVLDFVALAYMVWTLPRTLEEKHGRSLPYSALSFLGRHSLQVFAWSTCIAFCRYILNEHWARLSLLVQVCLLAVAVTSLFIPAWVHERMSMQARAYKIRLSNQPAV